MPRHLGLFGEQAEYRAAPFASMQERKPHHQATVLQDMNDLSNQTVFKIYLDCFQNRGSDIDGIEEPLVPQEHTVLNRSEVVFAENVNFAVYRTAVVTRDVSLRKISLTKATKGVRPPLPPLHLHPQPPSQPTFNIPLSPGPTALHCYPPSPHGWLVCIDQLLKETMSYTA